MAHRHEQAPSPVEAELLQRFERSEVPFWELCGKLIRARAAECDECQGRYLTLASRDAQASAAVFYLCWVVLVHQVNQQAAEKVMAATAIPGDPFPAWLEMSLHRWYPEVTLTSERIQDTANLLDDYDLTTRGAHLARSVLLADEALKLTPPQ
ncbi:hypothetical protein [Glycomyces sp. MUSA5-2]|uniref:hypothetical protein n=1 Tax=Glycomyces sp. MUSA5-2 TaxID=2053002 RepID=UPI00300B51F3